MAQPRLTKPLPRQGAPKFGPPLQVAGNEETFRSRRSRGPSKKPTQEDQDKADKAKQQQAIQDLIATWLARLQLISVISTFFASTESGLFGKALSTSTIGQVANICFMSALIIHAYSAVISFIGAFFLVQYKLTIAEEDEEEVETEMVDSPTSFNSDPEKIVSPTSFYRAGSRSIQGRARAPPGLSDQVWSVNPRLVQIGPFQKEPPTQLLSRCHSLCVFLTFLGFVLAIIGLISFAWDRQPLGISVAASITMTFCLTAGTTILIFPSTKTSHIFYQRKTR